MGGEKKRNDELETPLNDDITSQYSCRTEHSVNSLFAVSSRVPSLHSASTCGKCQCGRGYVRAELEHWDGRVSAPSATHLSEWPSGPARLPCRILCPFPFHPMFLLPVMRLMSSPPHMLCNSQFCIHIMHFFFSLFARPE